MEKYDELKKLLNEKDNFIRDNGIAITEISQGKATAELKVTTHHLNANNVVQGGVLFTMIDICGCAAILSYGKKAVTLNATINYLSAVSKGTIKAFATVIKKGRQTGLISVDIISEENKLIANGNVTAFIMAE